MHSAVKRSASLILSALLIATFVTTLSPTAQAYDLNPAAWTQTHENPVQKYPGVHVSPSVPITLSDGVTLRADIYRPAGADGRPSTDENPVLVNLTPYTKLVSMLAAAAVNIPEVSDTVIDILAGINLSGTPISGTEQLLKVLDGGLVSTFSVDPQLIRSGYTQIVVDVRGTGTSQGVWNVFGPQERSDSLEVLDWARQLPYSNGTTGMFGYSYSAVNQMQAASAQPEGLGAIFPASPMTDIVADVVAPGSGYGAGFLGLWLAAINSTKMIPDIPRLLRGEFDETWLRDRLQNPAVFVKEYLEGLTSPSAEDFSDGTADLLRIGSAHRTALTTDAAAIEVPTFVSGGWDDLFTNMEWRALDQLSALPASKKKLVIGASTHGTPAWDMRGRPGQPPSLDVLQRAWFDRWLKGIDNGIDAYAPATSHQLGGSWVQSDQFPRAGQEHRRLFLSPKSSGTSPTSVDDGSLATEPSQQKETLTVEPGLTTLCSGDSNRAMIGLLAWLDGCAYDNRIAERAALTFTSAPVRSATQVNGPISVRLQTKVDATDGFYVAVVSDVGPDGASRAISTGTLSVSMKNQLMPERSGYSPQGYLTDPYYAIDIDKRAPVPAGSVNALDIGTTATDALLKPGHRLRVSIYALNAPRAVPLGPILHDSGLKPQHVLLDPQSPSWVIVPSDRPIPGLG